MTVRTLVGLPLINDLNQPVSANTSSFFGTANPPGQNDFANGKGPNGTFLITDFFGTTAGDPHNDYFPTVNQLIQTNIANGNLESLSLIYNTMLNVVNGVYTQTMPSLAIVIPSDQPAAGTYASYNDALLALVAAAESQVMSTAAAIPAQQMTTLDQYWEIMNFHALVYEPTNQATAEIDFADIPTPSQAAVTSFVLSLDRYGQNTEAGQSGEYLQSIATSTFTGQATQGCLIEGRNEDSIDSLDLNRFNEVPDQPTTPPPRANLADASHTVAEARTIVQANLRRQNLS
jgi:hypothetical protein